MQPKISFFFKPSSPSTKRDPPPIPQDGVVDDGLALWEKSRNLFLHTYKRRSPNSESGSDGPATSKPGSNNSGSGKVLNKKRSYAQFYLDLGQSDFNLRACPTCGICYAPGDEIDEKDHKTFHKKYTYGIPFKVLRNERVVDMPRKEGERVVVVSECDPPALRKKAQDVIKMMEIELGDGWIFHKSCKVYMFISFKRVAGCLVAESIKEAFKVLSSSADAKYHRSATKDSRSISTTLKFGEIIFHREATKNLHSVDSADVVDGNLKGAIVCEGEAVPVACGVRAIWVTPSNRRKHIASQLLDAARRDFCPSDVLEKSSLAFSPPTSTGKALASSYTGTTSFLVYKPDTC